MNLGSPLKPAALMAALLLAGCSAFASTPEPSPQADGARPAARPAPQDGPAAYSSVITDEAVTDDGVITVHEVDGDYFWEIPNALLGRDFLMNSRIAAVPAGFSGFQPAGVSVTEQVIRFEKRGDQILMRKISFREIAADDAPIVTSVVANNFPPVLAAFDIETMGEGESTSVIDVTSFFAGDTPAISGLSPAARTTYGVRRLDTSRSFIDRMSAYPENVEVRHTTTYDAARPPTDGNAQTLTLQMAQSLVLLPEEPMRARYEDPRVGYFAVQRINYGLDELKAPEQRFIRRWRLEPSDPAAYARGEIVTPVEPITYYIDPATPTRWREFVRQGVEDWNVAFEAAGFRNAIRALDAPSPEEDPEWDSEDIRYSVVRWAASQTRNAQGPSTSDPRTGEIIESDIVWYHNHLRSYRNRLMLETGNANPLARTLDQSDEIIGEAMRQVIAHEIGHALGLPHNMIGSSAYPVDSLRNADFARRMGVSPSVMDYARQNYIAQPGDGLQPHDFIRQIGPYDLYSIEWGYRHIANTTPESERSTLNEWIIDHADDPMYRYLPQGGFSYDPRSQTEDMGDDPVMASTYGIMNLRAVTPNLREWTSRDGASYEDLAEIYGELWGQWNRYVNHVITMIGGAYVDLKSYDQAGPVFDGVPRAQQERALAFVEEQVFDTPTWLNDREILDRVGPLGQIETMEGRQASVLNNLLQGSRLGRLADMEVLQPEDAWPLVDYLNAVRDAVFGDLGSVAAIDGYSRALQRAWVERVENMMTEVPTASAFGGGSINVTRSDLRPILRSQLTELQDDIDSAANRVRHTMTQIHLEDLSARIDAILQGPER